MLLSILIVNYNSSKELLEVVKQLENEVKLPKNYSKKIFIVENGSTKPGEWEALQSLKAYSDIDLSISEKNLGFTGGNNLLIEKAKALNTDFYLLLNPDTVVDKNFIVNLVGAIHESPLHIGIASPKIYFARGFETHPERYKEKDLGHVIWYAGGIIDWDNVVGYHRLVDQVDKSVIASEAKQSSYGESRLPRRYAPRNDTPVLTDFCTGCCMLLSKEAMDKLKGFDNKYFLNLEDLDLSVRAKKAGFETVYVPSSVIWHKNAVSKQGTGSKIDDFWQTRNRLIFAFKYAKLKVKILLFLQLLKTADQNRLKAIFSALSGLV